MKSVGPSVQCSADVFACEFEWRPATWKLKHVNALLSPFSPIRDSQYSAFFQLILPLILFYCQICQLAGPMAKPKSEARVNTFGLDPFE